MTGKVYEGVIAEPTEWQVFVTDNGERKRLPLRLSEVNHSPTGFAWGYGGSGPAQLAYAILADALGSARARRLYMDFKFCKIATLDQDAGWTMTLGEIQAWAASADPRSKLKKLDPQTYPLNETHEQVMLRVARDQMAFGVAEGEHDLRHLLENKCTGGGSQ